MSIKVKIRKNSLSEISKREQRLKDRGIDYDLVGIPTEMKRLAAGITEEEELDEKKKEPKPQCSKGNPFHTGKDGKFSSKSDAGSYSLSEPVRGRNCTSGQASMPGRKIVRKDKRTKRCGRDKPRGTSKSRYRCKDGSAVWQEGDKPKKMIRVRIKRKPKTESMVLAVPPEWKEQERIQEELTAKLSKIADEPEKKPEKKDDDFIGVQGKYMKFINSLTREERIQVRNLFCYDRFSLKLLNDLSLASDGKLNEPPKKPKE